MENRFVKQSRVRGIALIATLLTVLFVTIFSSGCFLKSLLEADIDSCFEITDEKLDVSYTEDLGYSVKITGKAKIKYKDFTAVTLWYNVFDENGNNLGKVYAFNFNLYNGSTWTFSATSEEYFEKKPIYFEFYEIDAYEDKG